MRWLTSGKIQSYCVFQIPILLLWVPSAALLPSGPGMLPPWRPKSSEEQNGAERWDSKNTYFHIMKHNVENYIQDNVPFYDLL